jgi:hypothetical protein
MRRRRSGKVAFDQKVIQDVGMAALAVRILPMVISNFFPLDQTLYTAVGAGTGYITGTWLKNKTMANASIALGLVEFVAPVIENLVGGFGGGSMLPQIEPSMGVMTNKRPYIRPPTKFPQIAVNDYLNLNDYTSDISPQSVKVYQDSY